MKCGLRSQAAGAKSCQSGDMEVIIQKSSMYPQDVLLGRTYWRGSLPTEDNKGLRERSRRSRDGGSPGRTRTCDQPVNSRLLYQLSYRGTRQPTVGLCILAKAFCWGETFFCQDNCSPCPRLFRYTSKSSVSSSSEVASVLPAATDA